MKPGLLYTIAAVAWTLSIVLCAVAYVNKSYHAYPIILIIGLAGVLYCIYCEYKDSKSKEV